MLKKLVDMLKEEGMELLEDQVEIIVEKMFVLAQEEIAAGAADKPYLVMVGAALPYAKDLILAQVDKIDGKEG